MLNARIVQKIGGKTHKGVEKSHPQQKTLPPHLPHFTHLYDRKLKLPE